MHHNQLQDPLLPNQQLNLQDNIDQNEGIQQEDQLNLDIVDNFQPAPLQAAVQNDQDPFSLNRFIVLGALGAAPGLIISYHVLNPDFNNADDWYSGINFLNLLVMSQASSLGSTIATYAGIPVVRTTVDFCVSTTINCFRGLWRMAGTGQQANQLGAGGQLAQMIEQNPNVLAP